jgi:hypothetical protein
MYLRLSGRWLTNRFTALPPTTSPRKAGSTTTRRLLLQVHRATYLDIPSAFLPLRFWSRVRGGNHQAGIVYTECNRIRYTSLKMYCDQTNSNITTQFPTEHFLTLQDFLQVFNMAATGYVSDIHTII